MFDALISNIFNVPVGILIAAVSSWITVQLSIRQFRGEKWWERKADAYTHVIEALHNSKEFSDQHLDAARRGNEISSDRDAELRAKAKIGREEIRRARNIGAFLLSDKAISRLDIFKQEEDALNAEGWIDYLMSDLSIVGACLDDMIEMAKNDLKVKH